MINLTPFVSYDCRKEYLSRAASALRQGVAGNGTSSDDIKGIWVSSDDPTVISEVKQLAADFFPNVGEANIIWISSRAVSGIPNRNGTIPTATYAMVSPPLSMNVTTSRFDEDEATIDIHFPYIIKKTQLSMRGCIC